MAGVRGRSGGHNAKSVKAHKLAGTFQKVRHARIRNPEPPAGVPTQPKKLTGDAGAEWNRMLERLSQSKTLSTVDSAALYQYCRLFAETEGIAARHEHAVELLDTLYAAIRDLTGEALGAAIDNIVKLTQQEARYTTQIRQGRMAQRVYLVEFGLTPASRGRVKLPTDGGSGGADGDGWDDLDDGASIN